MRTRVKIRAADDRWNTGERASAGQVAKLVDDLPWANADSRWLMAHPAFNR